MLRQKRIPWDKDSISFRIEAPVVVKPEIVSKKALVNSGIAPVRTKGKDPNRLNMNQLSVTTRKPSLFPKILSGFLESKISERAPPRVIKVETPNIKESLSLYIKDTGMAKAINTASIRINLPRIYNTTRVLIILFE
jgi:hypothetical protein